MLFPKPADVNIDMSETRLVGMTFMEYIIPNLEFNLGYIVPAGNNLMSSGSALKIAESRVGAGFGYFFE